MNLEVSNLQAHQISSHPPRYLTTSYPLSSFGYPRRGESIVVLPIIKDLTPRHMSPHAPAILIPFLNQIIMAHHLRIEVEYLEG